jgi:hypothetical protein
MSALTLDFKYVIAAKKKVEIGTNSEKRLQTKSNLQHYVIFLVSTCGNNCLI